MNLYKNCNNYRLNSKTLQYLSLSDDVKLKIQSLCVKCTISYKHVHNIVDIIFQYVPFYTL